MSKLHTACTFASVTSEVEEEDDDDDATLEELVLPFFICLIVSTYKMRKKPTLISKEEKQTNF